MLSAAVDRPQQPRPLRFLDILSDVQCSVQCNIHVPKSYVYVSVVHTPGSKCQGG